MKIRTHYTTLNVSMSATQEEIKRAYRKLCNIHHPDKHPPEQKEIQEEIIKDINKSYSILSDGKLRAEHDIWIRKQQQIVIRNERAPVEVEKSKTRFYANTNMYREEYGRQKAESEIKERDKRRAKEAHEKNKEKVEREREREKERQQQWGKCKTDPFSYRKTNINPIRQKILNFNHKFLLLTIVVTGSILFNAAPQIEKLSENIYLHFNGMSNYDNESSKVVTANLDSNIENLQFPIASSDIEQTELTSVKRSGFNLSFSYKTTLLNEDIDVTKDIYKVFGNVDFCTNKLYSDLPIIINFKLHYTLNDTNREFTKPLSYFCPSK